MNDFAYFCGRTENIYTFERFRKLYRMNSLYILSVQVFLGAARQCKSSSKQPHSFLSKSLCFFYCKKQLFLQLFVTLIWWEIQAIKTEQKQNQRFSIILKGFRIVFKACNCCILTFSNFLEQAVLHLYINKILTFLTETELLTGMEVITKKTSFSIVLLLSCFMSALLILFGQESISGTFLCLPVSSFFFF